MKNFFTDLFSDKSELYAVARPRYPQALIEWVALMAPSRNIVWDCGTGNGQAAWDLKDHFEHVWATDPSEEQITHAMLKPGITYSVQAAERVDFPNQSVDAVVVAQALHWFDHARFFTEVKRVLRPKGVFFAWGYSWAQISPEIDAVVKEAILTPLEPFWAPQNAILWNQYQNIDMPLDRLELPCFEIEQHWSLGQYLAYMHTWSATRAAIRAKGRAFFEAGCARLEKSWGSLDTVKKVSMPLAVIAGRLPDNLLN